MSLVTEIACPSCRKAAEIAPGREELTVCQRCGCDLATLAQIARAADDALQQANGALAQGRYAEAMEQAGLSWNLRRASASARVACLAAGASGYTTDFLTWRSRARIEA